MNAIIVKLSAILLAISGILATLAGIAVYRTTEPSFGSAPSGLPARVASSSLATVNNITTLPRLGTVISATSTPTCTSRIISTKTEPIKLLFSNYNNQVPTDQRGLLQAASTTVAYDSGIYGCGQIKALSYDATTTISVTEVE